MTDFDTVIHEYSFNTLYRKLHLELIYAGIKSKPRNMEIYELLNCSLILDNPRHRLLESKVRKHSYTYACGEFFWYLRGSNSLEEMMFYLKRMKDFSDDGKTLNSAYGYRMYGNHKDFPNQWKNVIRNLCGDKDSRQAVITINYQHDLDKPTKDVPCTLNFQFLIRDNKLNMIARMRSNDSFMGLIYDVFCFTLFQETMFNTLKCKYDDLELGTYIHNTGSMHLYTKDEDRAIAVCREKIGAVVQVAIGNQFINDLITCEKSLRVTGKPIDKHGINGTYDWIAEKLNKQLTK